MSGKHWKMGCRNLFMSSFLPQALRPLRRFSLGDSKSLTLELTTSAPSLFPDSQPSILSQSLFANGRFTTHRTHAECDGAEGLPGVIGCGGEPGSVHITYVVTFADPVVLGDQWPPFLAEYSSCTSNLPG